MSLITPDQRARIENGTVLIRRMVATRDLVGLRTFDAFGGLAAIGHFADVVGCGPDLRGRLAAAIDDAESLLVE